jgi:phospholipid/cholesterol/gamma-HCH transport system substrate-binding protein
MGTVIEPPDRKSGNGRLMEDDLLSALPRRSANREVKVGFFVLAGIIAFLAILFTMTDVGTFRGRHYATTVVADAGGMRKGDPVQMRGVNIGRVIDFQMVPRGVAVKTEIYNEYPIPADSRADLKSNGIMGGVVVNVIPGRSSKPLPDYAEIPGTSAGSDVMAEAAKVAVRADTAMARVNLLLSANNISSMGKTVGSVNASAAQLQSLMAELNTIANQERVQLAAISTSLRRSAAGIEGATTGPELQRSIQQVDALTAQLSRASLTLTQTTNSLQAASSSLQAVMGRTERGEGTIGKLTSDDQLYANLNAAVSNLNTLISDIQANPKKYINLRVF